MAIAIYQDVQTGRHHWAEATSRTTHEKLDDGEWVLFDSTPDTPPPAADPFDAAMAARIPGSGLAAVALRAAFGLGATATDTAVEAFVGTPGTKTRASLLSEFGGRRSVPLPSGARITPLPGVLGNKFRYNASSFIEDNVTTVGSIQYAVWVNEVGNPTIGKRTLGSDQWQTFDLSTIPANPIDAPVAGDGHNVYVLAVDSDGYIHVAGDMHVHPLHYIRSTNPGDITAWTAPGMVGTDENGVSYPQFARRLNGEMLFIYRQTPGDPNNGDITVLNAYNAATKTWSRRAIVLDGTAAATKYAPYTNRLAVAPDGSLHLFYMWRAIVGGAADPSVGHLKSTDGGATWTQINGTAMTLPVTRTTHVEAASMQILNQQGADVDSNGRPHAAFTVNKGVGVAIRHLYWNGSAWVDEMAVDHSLEPASITKNPRVSLFCRGADTYLVYTLGQTGSTGGGGWSVRIRSMATNDRHVDFPLIEADLGHYEFSFDQRALRDRDELVALVTNVQTEDASLANVNLPKHLRAWGGILTFPLSAIRVAAGVADAALLTDRVWIPAAEFGLFEGTPAEARRTGFGGWELPDAATTSVAALSKIPDRWQGYNVDIWWVNQAAAAGAIRVRAMVQQLAPGASLDSAPGNYGDATVTLTAGANGVATMSRVMAAQPRIPYDRDRLVKVVVRRLGADGADTLAANALVLGVMLSPALLP